MVSCSFVSLASALALSSVAYAAPIRREFAATDILVFQFAGVLECLETQFYTQALAKFQDSDFTSAGFGNVNIPKEIFSTILVDETTHTTVIDTALISFGVEPLSKQCKFDFGNALDSVESMAATARVIENVGVSAYLGGANLLEDKELLIAAASIMTVEARHQSLLNVLNVATSIPSPFDIALSPSQVLAIAGGFISGCDLGIPTLPALSVTNTGTIEPGTSLTFNSDAISSSVDSSTLTCQMMTGGAPFALTLPFDNCIVPNINGPVYIFVVNGTQPLLNSQTNQFSASIVAGPLLTFIDTVPETLGQVAKSAPETVSSSQMISNAQAVQLANQASSNGPEFISVASTSALPTATGGASGGPAISVIGFSSVTASAALATGN